MNLTGDEKYLLLMEISQKLRDTLDLDEIMEHMLDTIKTVLDYDAAGIFVLNQDLVHKRNEQPRELIAGMSQRGFDLHPVGDDAMLTQGKGIVGHVISTANSVVASDVTQNPHYVVGRERTRSEIAVPIIRKDRAIGALNLESDNLGAYEQSDLEVLQFFADAAAIALEKAMLHRQILDKELVDKQLQLAREVQYRLFPDKPPIIPGYDAAGICIPAEEIGGDYFDLIKLARGRLGAAVADVSGHGIAPALVMTSFRGLLRMHTHGQLDPARIARTINRLMPEFTANDYFITAVYAVLDPDSHTLEYVCCGNPPPLHLHANTRPEILKVHGPALGVFRRVGYTAQKVVMQSGDMAALYTDGVVELTNSAGEEYGPERLAHALQQGKDEPADFLIQRVIQDTQIFSGSKSHPDDFTLVIIKRL